MSIRVMGIRIMSPSAFNCNLPDHNSSRRVPATQIAPVHAGSVYTDLHAGHGIASWFNESSGCGAGFTPRRSSGNAAPPKVLFSIAGHGSATLIISLAISAFIIIFLLHTIKILFPSMMPSLDDQERISTSTSSSTVWEPIERGDIVVFRYPRDPSKNKTKRVIGADGDHIRIDGGEVYVNGQLLDELYVPAEYARYAVLRGGRRASAKLLRVGRSPLGCRTTAATSER